jgi:hypothetical protein
MGQLADLIQQSKRPNGPVCATANLLHTLPKAEAADLRAALADQSVPGTSIARALVKLGHKISGSTIQRHRRGECGCGTPS